MNAMAPCPCGSGTAYAACCGPLHDGAPAATAEALMRSRYTAYALGRTDHVFRTWHPRTRPDDLAPDPGVTWTGLEVLATEAGGPDDDRGVVEFRAHFRTAAGAAGAAREVPLRAARRPAGSTWTVTVET